MTEPTLSTPADTINLELFFELSPDMLCIAGYDGYFKKINPAVSQVLGYTNDELFARPINDFIHPEDQAITEKHRNNLKRHIPLLNYENRYICKNGEVVWLSWTSMPNDASETVYAIAKNITHKKKLEADRNSLITKLTSINNDLKQLTYTTSHDLRSPVNNLLTVFTLLDTSKIQDTETLEFIGILKDAADSLKYTLNSYVDVLSEKNGLIVKTEEIHLNDCLNSVAHSLSALIQSSHTTINADFNDLPNITFNRTYLESIFLNLITNAIKYARPGVAPIITIQSAIVNAAKQITFIDEGSGFDMEKVKHKVFGLNQKFHNYSDSKGIGLYLVYNHITSMGGQISLDSKPNQGAVFTITFKD
ncbi:PAS domain-containing sensor histidine kinase [Mucilaginibacter phyllosphaerae]|uniref:histidine kinase n=1 Tax=Mucilaginibacter phyllosphaerae TaxID=1812349 RepID=A0A4Y8A7G5_9SPHI|nr:PAS domain-containing sensor histidine kinase [Mucilaginibacter phyllosphaerae]MBB3971004.1 PAS domain S-box-containing protein [Mucilaginibacter phyllosphaerae]TEW63748.1 PAS domain-containing sensor histidine kinase [Mucilaginibacter phyllosphaerae]GGH21905.1 hypothetical protein GCM10007352_34890 [Mucilaginibacter phyllosphaerae]